MSTALSFLQNINSFDPIFWFNRNSMEPLAYFLHVASPPETLLQILELLPPSSLYTLVTSSHSRRLYFIASYLLWKERHIYSHTALSMLISTLENSRLYANFIETLEIGTHFPPNQVGPSPTEIWGNFFHNCIQRLSSLRTLIVHFGINSDFNESLGFAALATYCPRLSTLRLTCCPVNINLISYAQALNPLTNELTIIDISFIADMTRELFKLLGEKSPRLTEFTWNMHPQYNSVDDDAIISLISHCPDLKLLNLLDSPCTTDRTLVAIGLRLPKLEAFHFRHHEITDLGVQALVKGCPKLRRISLGSQKITELSAMAIANNCPLIEYVDLDSDNITDAGLHTLGKGCCLLKEAIFYSDKITDNGVAGLVENIPHLKNLRLHSSNITDISLNYIASSCEQLISIGILSNYISDKGLRTLGNGCSHLETIYVQSSTITTKGIITLAKKCNNLIRADFSKASITEEERTSIKERYPYVDWCLL